MDYTVVMPTTCTIEGCDRPHLARGWCNTHYSRWYVTGDPVARKRMYRAAVADRLASKLALDDTGCLIFTGWVDARGYGRFKVDGKMRKPHRVAYEEWVGPIPPGADVCHKCDNPSCCNPLHLFAGTHSDNMRDMAVKGRAISGRVRGHGDVLRASAARRRASAATSAGAPATWKQCSRCEEFKAPEAFGSNIHRPDGLQTYCRPCFNEYRRSRKAD